MQMPLAKHTDVACCNCTGVTLGNVQYFSLLLIITGLSSVFVQKQRYAQTSLFESTKSLNVLFRAIYGKRWLLSAREPLPTDAFLSNQELVIKQQFNNQYGFHRSVIYQKTGSLYRKTLHQHSKHTSFLVTLIERTLSTMAASSSLGFSCHKNSKTK